MPRRYVFAILAVLLLISVLRLVPSFAQRLSEERQALFHDMDTNRQPPPGTEFVFARVQYTTTAVKRGYDVYHRLEGWAHDYPVAEEHIMQIANESTGINLNHSSYVIVHLDSDEIFKYPFLYFSEVGEMNLTDREVANFREYLNRGGFAVVDDFDNQELLDWFASEMRMVFPARNFVELKVDNPIFHTFYDMATLNIEAPPKPRRRGNFPPKFYGYYDDHGRICMVINYNNDIGDFWEWIDEPVYKLGPSVEGVRLGIDYFIYSMTH